MEGNKTVIDRLMNFMERLEQACSSTDYAELNTVIENAKKSFEDGMDNDLNTPVALASVFDFMNEINKNFDKISKSDAEKIKMQMLSFDSVLGLLKQTEEKTLTSEQEALIAKRQEYRLAKNWANADALKKQLLDMGIEVKDTPNGPVWKFI